MPAPSLTFAEPLLREPMPRCSIKVTALLSLIIGFGFGRLTLMPNTEAAEVPTDTMASAPWTMGRTVASAPWATAASRSPRLQPMVPPQSWGAVAPLVRSTDDSYRPQFRTQATWGRNMHVFAEKIAAADVQKLRQATGVGMMDAKKALVETEGDFEKASVLLRQKGLATAEKKASRATAAGLIHSYMHSNSMGIMVEVNCETDFVSKGDDFRKFVDNLAMQVAACPEVEYVNYDEISKEEMDKERAILAGADDLKDKPDAIKDKMIEGRLKKIFKPRVLMDSEYIQDPDMTVEGYVKDNIQKFGENIKVARFTRYILGQGAAAE